MRTIELSPRLQSVARLVPQGARLADVGTDHAYLPVYLIQRGVIERAIASDLRPGPLERARATLERYGMEENITLRLCDGLAGIQPEEVDAVTIAGMGGETISAILQAAPWCRQGECSLILQPMSAQEDLRRWLGENGYAIEREVLSREGTTIYLTILARAGEMPPLTPAQLWAGRQERGQEEPLRLEYLEHLLRRASRAAAGLRQSSRPADAQKLEQLEPVIEGLSNMIEEWKAWQQ
jgi:tRNA (adenine22-N1)-methyltransferase